MRSALFNYKFCFSIVFFVFQFGGLYAQQELAVIPKPQVSKKVDGLFIINSHTSIITDENTDGKAAYYLQNELLKHKILPLSIQTASESPAIRLSLVPGENQKEGAYKIAMKSGGVHISATNEEGLFLGTVTLLQMIRQAEMKDGKLSLSCWNIEDAPFYDWRGLMLDESRHFFGKEKVKDILDWMAFYKLNKFHWHLTDQTGWRIEIKKYPKLTLIGGIGNNSDPFAPAQYYTQEEIKEIVAYAGERFIDVIPEIDMPGHATAANMAYPAFSGGGSQRYPEFTFNPGKDEVYQYLTDILKEIDALFPYQKIHIGGDEVHFGNESWKTDEAVQQLMRDKKFKDLKEVENYFIHRMGDSILNLNNEIMAWDEVVGSELPPEKTTVYWWRHDKPEVLKEALKKGFHTILSPRLPLYFDFVQDSTHTIGRKWQKGFVPLESVYNFPSAAILDLPNAGKLLRGVQANLWTEVLSTGEQFDYMLFPRITALSESAWTKPSNKDYGDFQKRLKQHLLFFAEEGLYYFDPFIPQKFPEYLSPAQRNNMAPDTDNLTKQEQGKND